MSIYQKKQRWKLWLAGGAALIVIASLYYTNELVKNVAIEERKKVELWADAVRSRATLVQYTERLFERLKVEERKRTEIWAQAQKNINVTEEDDARSFYLKVVSENTTIPAIIVDEKNRINHVINVDTAEIKIASIFSGKIKNDFSKYDPIIINDGFSNNYYIYYQDSKVFLELRDVLDNIIKSFISEVVVNSASVPVIVADSSSTKIIASGNLSNALSTDTTAMLKLTKNMSGDNTPFRIDLPEYGPCLIYYQN